MSLLFSKLTNVFVLGMIKLKYASNFVAGRIFRGSEWYDGGSGWLTRADCADFFPTPHSVIPY